jgi:hypothetical protein
MNVQILRWLISPMANPTVHSFELLKHQQQATELLSPSSDNIAFKKG